MFFKLQIHYFNILNRNESDTHFENVSIFIIFCQLTADSVLS